MVYVLNVDKQFVINIFFFLCYNFERRNANRLERGVYMKQRIENMDLKEKRVIVRCDYNVPIYNGKILDDTKIVASLETIRYLMKNNCKIIILSHLGKVKTEEDKRFYSLEIAARRLQELIGRDVYFSHQILDPELPKRIDLMLPRDILMLENTRFLDVPNKLESKCDAQVSNFFASLADVFVNDAFASSHRAHASVVGITKYIPSCIGFSVEKELAALDRFLKEPEHPFTVIMGGAKVEDKLELIKTMLPKCDHLLLAGGLANSFLKALNFNIGSSLATESSATLESLKQIMLEYRDKLMLPLDAIVGSTYDEHYTRYKRINEIGDNEVINDIGIKTLEKYKTAILESKTIFLNGTMGIYEDVRYSNGTKELLAMLKKQDAIKIAGGGDAVSAVKTFGYEGDFTYLSVGGGATLEYLTKGHLVGIDSIMEASDIEILDV